MSRRERDRIPVVSLVWIGPVEAVDQRRDGDHRERHADDERKPADKQHPSMLRVTRRADHILQERDGERQRRARHGDQLLQVLLDGVVRLEARLKELFREQ